MAGLAHFIGGVGDAAHEYGQQIRGILESRRHDFASMLSKAADEESDPQTLIALRKHHADLISGKPIGKIAQGVSQTLQKKAADNQALLQVFGQPPQQKEAAPGPAAPGRTPGTAPVAAQSPTSPVQPLAQIIGSPGRQQVESQGEPSPANLPESVPTIINSVVPPPVSPASAQTALTQAPIQPVESYQPQDSQAIVQKYMNDPRWQAPANRPILLNAMQRELDRNEALRSTIGTHQYELGEKRRQLEFMKQQPWWSELPQHIRAAYEAEAGGLGAVNPAAGMMVPRMISPSMRGSDAPPGAVEFGTTTPLDPNKFYRREYSPMFGDVWTPILGPAPVTTQTSGGGVQLSDKYTGKSIGPVEGAVAPSQNTPHFQATENGGVQMITAAGVKNGKDPTPVPGAVIPSMLPTTSVSEHAITTIGPDGKASTQIVPFTGTRTKGGIQPVGAPASSGGGRGSAATPRTFEKPLSPLQELNEEQKLGQYELAATRASRILDNSHLLDSLIESGKLNLQMHNGLLASIINRNVPLTPQEAQMVADFNSLTETVNLLRGPLGATGFRGPEAFAALQNQRGNLMANPEVTRLVLKTFLQEVQKQAGPIAQKLRKPSPLAPEQGGNAPVNITLPSGKTITIK